MARARRETEAKTGATGVSADAPIAKPMPSGRVAFYFEDRQEFMRCLEEVSRYEGLMCEVVPFRVIVVDTLMAKVCRKRGIVPARAWDVKPPQPMPDEEVARLMKQLKQMSKDAGLLPPDT